MSKNICGPCSLCCELLPVPQLNKPESVMCSKCDPGNGCTIHETRPQICRTFDCVFLQSDSKEMGEELRPINCHVVFEKVNETLYLALEDPKYIGSHKNPKVKQYIDKLNEDGISVIVSSFSNAPKVFLLAEGDTPEIVLKKANDEYNKIK